MQEKKNIINIDEIKNILTDIKIQSEIIDSSLKNIEEIINESLMNLLILGIKYLITLMILN